MPRNPQIPANRDRALLSTSALCGPLRDDHARVRRVLRAVQDPDPAQRRPRAARFFHNGVIHSLEQAVRFYNTRDTRPELWYPTVGGRVQKFDDLPAAYRKNLDRQLPLDGRASGTEPPMSERQVRDLVCFLRTLTDDYRPGTPPDGDCVD